VRAFTEGRAIALFSAFVDSLAHLAGM
jgi:hypothetical protein